jgi:hypothetical protein
MRITVGLPRPVVTHPVSPSWPDVERDVLNGGDGAALYLDSPTAGQRAGRRAIGQQECRGEGFAR